MTHCFACDHEVVPTPPRRAYWLLIAAFWGFSLMFGLGAAAGSGWAFTLLLAWLLLASITGALVQRATSWSCSECGATLPSPSRVPGATQG